MRHPTYNAVPGRWLRAGALGAAALAGLLLVACGGGGSGGEAPMSAAERQQREATALSHAMALAQEAHAQRTKQASTE
jgi:hypothetical protein